MSSLSPPPSRSHRVPLAAAGLAVLLVIVGMAVLVARTGEPATRTPAHTGGPGLATTAEVAPADARSSAPGPAPVVVRPNADPRITAQRADSGRLGVRGCAESVTEVTAVAADDLHAVRLTWDTPGGGSGSTTMTKGPESSWSASLGPFDESGVVVWQVVATDSHGNAAIGDPLRLIVGDCGARATTLS
ncbi:hypothetical protein [Prauserella cavernicola]|uniref:Uncharacterized protein n=1 Tax=Prauserella cavernicola TaxID=2800127 RepID=A0A934QQM3_9PSEU|nr:hypothetical protein [Prauserella cavernicola]MBK1784336.1 hypothetical protein [Prauserella cavernicola]